VFAVLAGGVRVIAPSSVVIRLCIFPLLIWPAAVHRTTNSTTTNTLTLGGRQCQDNDGNNNTTNTAMDGDETKKKIIHSPQWSNGRFSL